MNEKKKEYHDEKLELLAEKYLNSLLGPQKDTAPNQTENKRGTGTDSYDDLNEKQAKLMTLLLKISKEKNRTEG